MSNRPSLDDYVDVAERIQDFKDAHPQGTLRTVSWDIREASGLNTKTGKQVTQTFIVYHAEAYRSPDDPMPGQGIAWEPFPGLTPYTSQSELMNAETAAWGRAIIALGLVANRSLASRQEVRNRQAEQAIPDALASERKPNQAHDDAVAAALRGTTTPTLEHASGDTIARIRDAFNASGKSADWMKLKLVEITGNDVDSVRDAMAALTLDQALQLFTALGGVGDLLDDGVPGSGA